MSRRVKRIAVKLVAAGVIACGTAAVLHTFGWILFWVFAAVVVLAFPPVVLALFLWWMADEGTEDIPFIGY